MTQVSSEGLRWFQDAKFGMFIHWGLYSLLARGEWVMHNDGIPVSEYETLMHQFNPTKFNADEWVSIAAGAGQKYMVITSRHHDGFSMYDTALSDYKITRTPFGRDPLHELADACARRRDVKLGFYSSLLDWHHPAYRFRNESGLAWADYLEFLHGQVRELCTQFGEIACLWFDGDWPSHLLDDTNAYFAAGGSFEYDRLYEMIHTLQPDAVVLNNRHAEPLPGEDVQGFEQDLPGHNTAGFNTTTLSKLPMEVCMTINDSWGVNTQDENHKSSQHLIRTLARSASVGANYLLNVGPTAHGEILPVHAERLRAVGKWLGLHGDSVYRTRAGVVAPASAGTTVSTCSGETHYVHVFDYISDCVTLRGVPQGMKAALLRDNSTVKLMTRAGDVVLTIPAHQRDFADTVIRLESRLTMEVQMSRKVLVTGADAGLGLSLVKRFLQGGYAVFAGVRRSAADLNILVDVYGGLLTLVPLDVAEMDSVRAAARMVIEQTDAIDIVINNAGIHLKQSQQPLEQLDLADLQLQQTMEVNAFGPLRVVQQFLSLLENGGQKLILNISSEAGSITDCGRESQFAYCMSKAALNMQSRILHNYLKPRGFRVLAVHPGWMRTNMGGPAASISPDESAAGIFQLARREWNADDPIYMDYVGQPLPW